MAEDATYRDFIAPLQDKVGGLSVGQQILFQRTEAMQKEARETERELATRIDSVVGNVRSELNQKIDNLAVDMRAELAKTEARLMAAIVDLKGAVQAAHNVAQDASVAATVIEAKTDRRAPLPTNKSVTETVRPLLDSGGMIMRAVIVIIVVALAGEKGIAFAKGWFM